MPPTHPLNEQRDKRVQRRCLASRFKDALRMKRFSEPRIGVPGILSESATTEKLSESISS